MTTESLRDDRQDDAGWSGVDGSQDELAYRQIRTIRRVEERILDLRRADLILGSVHPCVGQEAVPVGVVRAMSSQDRVVATYRGHGWALACGVTPAAMFAELLGRSTGTNGGRAGSAYLTAPEVGFVGENSIVGAGLPIADGIALAATFTGSDAVAVVSFGDGATNQGASHEAMVFAIARRLPVVFVCENNLWSEMTPITDTVPDVGLADRARGYGMFAEQVDGTDVVHVAAAARRAVDRARRGDGPTFLECMVPRILGHYNGDIEHYRSAEDRAAHAARDPLAVAAAVIGDASAIDRIDGEVEEALDQAQAEALAAPMADPATAAEHVTAPVQPFRVTEPGPDAVQLAYGLAVNRALSIELEQRAELLVYGEDIAIPGGTFGVTRNLRKRHGDRVFDTPISESAILGSALGASLAGMRPVVEIMYMDFLYVAFDQLLNHASNVRYLSRGTLSAPMVVRLQQGSTPGQCAQHTQSLEAIISHVPGLNVAVPSSSQDAFAMLRAAIADDDPTVFIEARRMYLQKGLVDVDAPVEPIGGARLLRDGADLAIITWSTMVPACMDAAERLAEQGVSAAVLDLRWLRPLDDEAIADIVRRCGGRVLVVHEANLTGGFGAEISARIVERHFAELTAPIGRVGAPDIRVPAAPTLQTALLPDAETVVARAMEMARAR